MEHPPFIIFVAKEVGKLMDFILLETDDNATSAVEARIPLFSGELWQWAEQAAVSYWKLHGHMQSFSSCESDPMSSESYGGPSGDDDLPYVKDAKKHYRNVVMFSYDILGGNDPSWVEDAWEHPRVVGFIEELMKPFTVSSARSEDDSHAPALEFDGPGLPGPEKAALRSRRQHVFALALIELLNVNHFLLSLLILFP